MRAIPDDLASVTAADIAAVWAGPPEMAAA
jgi:hypothetical protein